MIGKVRPSGPDMITFTDADPQANNLNAGRVQFSPHKRPSMTLEWNEAAPNPSYILDLLRQLTQHDWKVEAKGRKTIEITYLPDPNYEGERKSN